MRCPLCKADNASGPNCRRCRADLSLLFTLEEQRQVALARARGLLQDGWWEAARGEALRAEGLRSGDDSLRLLGLASLLTGDHHTAWACARRGGTRPPA